MIDRLTACDYAEHVLSFWESKFPADTRPRQAIEIARKYARGQVGKEVLDQASEEAFAASVHAQVSASETTNIKDFAEFMSARSAALTAYSAASDIVRVADWAAQTPSDAKNPINASYITPYAPHGLAATPVKIDPDERKWQIEHGFKN